MPTVDTFRTDELTGWVRPGNDDRKVLLLHGGPGLSHDYLLPLAETLDGWTVASFQQRGLAPSTTEGPFDITTAVADVAKVLDELGWERPLIAGHSWGGLLAWHVAAALGDRLGGVLTIDSMGAVGDMGMWSRRLAKSSPRSTNFAPTKPRSPSPRRSRADAPSTRFWSLRPGSRPRPSR